MGDFIFIHFGSLFRSSKAGDYIKDCQCDEETGKLLQNTFMEGC